jgi:hypothetical protein
VDVTGNAITIKYQIENKLPKYLEGSSDVMNNFAYWAPRHFNGIRTWSVW